MRNRLSALLILAVFYGIYFGKMMVQRIRGIRTDQMGSRKEKKLHRVEMLMKTATLAIVPVQLLSIVTGWNVLREPVRCAGVVIGFLGDGIFLAAVVCMKDSWRAGIPDQDKTEIVTNGIYRISRNPAFLGFDLMYVGIFLMYGNALTGAFTLFAVIMLHLQILQEEIYLEEMFGEVYRNYKKHVRRYLGKRQGKG